MRTAVRHLQLFPHEYAMSKGPVFHRHLLVPDSQHECEESAQIGKIEPSRRRPGEVAAHSDGEMQRLVRSGGNSLGYDLERNQGSPAT